MSIHVHFEALLGEQTERVGDMAFSPSGTMLAAVSQDGQLTLWNVSSRSVIGEVSLEQANSASTLEPMPRLAFSPDGRFLATITGSGKVRLTQLTDGPIWQPHLLPMDGGNGTAVAFSLDGTLLGAGTSKGVLYLWDVASRTTLAKIHVSSDDVRPAGVRGLAFDPDSHHIAAVVVGSTALIRLIDYSGVPATPPRHAGSSGSPLAYVYDSAYCSTAATLAVAGAARSGGVTSNGIWLFGPARFQPVRTLPADDDPPVAVCLSPNARLLGIGSGIAGLVRIQSVADGMTMAEFVSNPLGWGEAGPDWNIEAIAWSPEGHQIAVAGSDIPDGVEFEMPYTGPLRHIIKLWAVSGNDF